MFVSTRHVHWKETDSIYCISNRAYEPNILLSEGDGRHKRGALFVTFVSATCSLELLLQFLSNKLNAVLQKLNHGFVGDYLIVFHTTVFGSDFQIVHIEFQELRFDRRMRAFEL